MKASTKVRSDIPEVLIIAAEESSALYALRLLELWKSQGLEIRAFGVGNREMEKAGFEILGRSEELAVMGLSEIWSHWDVIKKAFYDVVRAAQKRRPRFVLLMDYPGFNLRLAKRMHELGIPVVYYIPPQVWAWRQGRVKKMRKWVNENLVLFPFEEEFYKKHGVPATFVGHPLVDEIETEPDVDQQKWNRQRFGIPEGKVVLGLMPGSRRGELKLNLETQIRTAEILVRKNPSVQPVLLLAPSLEKRELENLLPPTSISLITIQSSPKEMIALTDVILCASGTATLMVGLLEKPMVIMYRMRPLSAFLAKRVVKVKYFGLVNLIMDREVAPERFQEAANPEHLAELLSPLITDSQVRERKILELRELKTKLGTKGSLERVARHLRPYLEGVNFKP